MFLLQYFSKNNQISLTEKMGQHQNSTLQKLTADYRINRREPEQMRTFLTHSSTQREYLFRELAFNELRQFSLTVQKLRMRKQVRSPHITILQLYEDRVEDAMCSSFYKAYSLWEYPHQSLQQELNQRIKNNDSFTHEQMRTILTSVVDGLNVFQQFQIKHQLLSTESILNDKNGLWKVADPLTLGYLNNYELLSSDPSGYPNLYLSPEQCWSIDQQKPIQSKNAFKNDVFTAGVIMLQCGLLQNQKDCYSQNYSNINWQILQERINQFSRKYSEGNLQSILRAMLAKDTVLRPDWVQLKGLCTKKMNYSKSNIVKSQAPRGEKAQNTTALVGGLSTILSLQNEGTTINYPTGVSAQPQLTSIVHNIRESSPQPINRNTTINFISSPVKKESINYSNIISPRHASYAPPQQQHFRASRQIHQMETKQIVSSPKNQINFQVKPRNYVSPIPSIVLQKSQQPSSYRFSSPNHGIPHATQGGQNKRNTVNWDATFGRLPNVQQSTKQPQPINYSLVNCQPPQKKVEQVRLQTLQPQLKKQKKSKEDSQLQLVEQYFKLGSKYEGYKLNGKRHGKGTFHYQDGGRYEGQWKFDQMNGRGVLYYQSNVKAYEGEWLNDQFHGKGALFNQNPQPLTSSFNFRNFDEVDDCWVSYEGQFKNDAKEGQGTLTLSNGEKFEGSFKADMVEGEGRFYTLSKGVVQGKWLQNQLVSLKQNKPR